MDSAMINKVMEDVKSKASYAYEVVFLDYEDSIQDIIANPSINYRDRDRYIYLSEEPCFIGDVVVVTTRKNNHHRLVLGLVLGEVESIEASLNSCVADRKTGMIIGRVDYPTRIREMCTKKEEIQKKKELLQERIRREAEKLALNSLLASNPELAKDVENFRAENPEVDLLGEGYVRITGD